MINSIKSDRQGRILSLLSESELLSIQEVARRLGRVSAVTVRRDVAEMAERGLLVRRHGSVSRLGAGLAESPTTRHPIEGQIGDVDAIVLPPIEGRGADTLRSMVRRRRIPFLAESSEQEGGVYIGPDNFAVGRELGNRAGRLLSGQLKSARVLLVSLDRLPNTRSRCDGFLKGFSETFKGKVESWRVDGRGRFRDALNVSLDACAVHPGINVAFGVNDHSILAALEASDRAGLSSISGFCVGGEGGALFEALSVGRKLRACAALFPEIVGKMSIDALAAALDGEELPKSIRTPHAILTNETLGEFYQRRTDGWALRDEAADRLSPPSAAAVPTTGKRVIGFVPHYPAHDWYRNMMRAMRSRADALGMELRVAAPQAGIAREIGELRRLIVQTAVRKVKPGETIAINAGEIGLMLARELASASDVTVVTNSLEIMEFLAGNPGVKVILTSGEYYPKYRCLVGPSLGALFETLRVDRVFLSVDGLTARFGPSSADERMALAARRFAEAGREICVLADHSIVAVDANNRIVPLRAVAEVITDTGSLPADRLALAAAGVALTIADEAAATTPQTASVEADAA
ncbi:substrate-binding domain-containing protein [Mesorhizobium sp. ZC-5]|uniref:substrate-binding domain-containing protein n=1 Tax=Mesorhizobium sp. ZC-5 TaxID=2986066 RepID=UPI0021E79E82|nr:substrate-binding domain-containing protein [Mesorhizobium sp. ZC-5]MCV3240718.1 DeoR family transcriptional regulator [Mesorhizobium sp. ZC-5]